MSKATKKLLITASASVFLMAATSAPIFAAPSNPGYYVGNQKYLLSDIAANPSLLVQLNNNLNTKGLSSFIADLPEGRLNYAQFMAANPGKLNLSAFKTFAAAHPAVIPADAVIVRPDGTEQRDPDSPLPGISVQNGLITVSFSSAPSVTPTIKDFVVTQSVYGGSNPQVIVPSGLQLNSDGTVVLLSVPTIAATDIAQNIVYTVAYKLSSTVSAGFTLAANPTTGEPVGQAAISTVSTVNGTITVNFNKPVSVAEATYGMKISRSIDGGAGSTEVPSLVQVSGNTVTFKVAEVQSAAADQNVVYSLSYLNGTAINTVKFTVAKIPATIVSASAVNGTITVNFDKAVSVVEATYDMKISRSINGGAGTTEEPSLVQASGNTVTFKVTEVQSAAADQNVVYSLSYLNGTAINTVKFTVAKIPAKITSASAVNGTITVNFDKAVSDVEATNGMKISRSINSGTGTTEVPSLVQASGSTVTFKVAEVQFTDADQSVAYSLSYQNQTAYNTVSFNVAKIIVSAVNGSVTVKFTTVETVSEAIYQNLKFKQSIDEMTPTNVTPTASVLDSVNNSVTYTVPAVQKLYTEQTVTYSVYNWENPAAESNTFKTVLKSPTINTPVNLNSNNKIVTGTGEPDFKIKVKISDGTHSVENNAEVIVGTDDNFTVNFFANLGTIANGPITLTVTQRDKDNGREKTVNGFTGTNNQ
ncbi:hypothetical protein OB236_03325 [Paenibacillus sp. WQ 127069]|uniref:Uncharacterized protein n=1 Tax=Paenibacillus baimaensis TaxID=2982185 RepID=A0ABT2U985_9BACL|nr:hypothetical protein [Paenibacillus sp. WQ 127069]MCU6791155.1 hypothetical protein [Paenibacillus sp. WQ 127069]